MAFMFIPDEDEIKLNRFISSLINQDIVVEEALENFVVTQSIDIYGEKTYQLLNRLFENKIVVYASEKEFTLEGKKYKAGSLVIRTRGNKNNIRKKLQNLADEISIHIYGVNTGFSTQGSLLGADTFKQLAQPKIALLSGNGLSNTSFGSLWFTIDKELNLPHILHPVS